MFHEKKKKNEKATAQRREDKLQSLTNIFIVLLQKLQARVGCQNRQHFFMAEKKQLNDLNEWITD